MILFRLKPNIKLANDSKPTIESSHSAIFNQLKTAVPPLSSKVTTKSVISDRKTDQR